MKVNFIMKLKKMRKTRSNLNDSISRWSNYNRRIKKDLKQYVESQDMKGETKMKKSRKMSKRLSNSFSSFMRKENAYKIVNRVSILVIVLSILLLTYTIDHSGFLNPLPMFTLVILSLYFIALAGSLWIFSKFRSIRLMKTTFLKVTALMISIVGLLIIFQTLEKSQSMRLTRVFFLLIGTAIPLTIGKMIWDLTKEIEDEYVIKKVDKKRVRTKNSSAHETFIMMQNYREEMDEEIEKAENEKGDSNNDKN